MLNEGIFRFDKITIVPNMRAELIEKSKTCPLVCCLLGSTSPPQICRNEKRSHRFWQEQGLWFEIL